MLTSKLWCFLRRKEDGLFLLKTWETGWCVVGSRISVEEGSGAKVYHEEELGWGALLKAMLANAGDSSSILTWGRSPGGGNGNPFQYSCLRNPRDRGAWRAAVLGVTEESAWMGHACARARHFQAHSSHVRCK